jgi:hypothetical protein
METSYFSNCFYRLPLLLISLLWCQECYFVVVRWYFSFFIKQSDLERNKQFDCSIALIVRNISEVESSSQMRRSSPSSRY